MEAIERRGDALQYLAVEPDGYDPDKQYPLVVLLHGFGSNMSDLAGLCPSIDPEGYVYICPNAPISMQVGLGAVGYAWTQPGDSGTPDEADRAEQLISTLMDEVTEQYRVEAGQVVLGGFSQGGMMTYRCGLTNPGMFRAVVALSARVSDSDSLRERLPADRSQPIFIAHGTADTMIAVEDARQARRFLEAEGYEPRYEEYAMGHEITQGVLDDLAPWVRSVLPPFRSDTALS